MSYTITFITGQQVKARDLKGFHDQFPFLFIIELQDRSLEMINPAHILSVSTFKKPNSGISKPPSPLEYRAKIQEDEMREFKDTKVLVTNAKNEV